MKLNARKLHKFKYSKPLKLSNTSSDFILVIATSKTLKKEFSNLKNEFGTAQFPNKSSSLYLLSPTGYKCKQLLLVKVDDESELFFKVVKSINGFSDVITRSKSGSIWVDPTIKSQELLINIQL